MTTSDAVGAGSPDLTGKVTVITGAAQGIGRAIATELAHAGARVVIGDIRGAERTAEDLLAAGLDVSGATLDVCSEESAAAFGQWVAQNYGGVDILINNAGLFATLTPRPFEEIDVAEWRRVMDVNVLGCFLMARTFVPPMRERGGGRIVNIGSATAFKGIPNLLHYTSSKGAVHTFTRSLASEVGRDGILVNAIAPGFTVSDGVLEHQDSVRTLRSSAPGKRLINREMVPADVVGAVRFFCSPAAAFITGQTLVVDGGAYFH